MFFQELQRHLLLVRGNINGTFKYWEDSTYCMDNVIKYYGKSFETRYIETGSYVPAFGRLLSDEYGVGALVDGDNLESLVREMKDAASRYDRAGLKTWLKSGNIDVDENLFTILLAFTSVYDEHFGFEPDPAKRAEIYAGKVTGNASINFTSYDLITDEILAYNAANPPKLSELLTANAAQCSEVAALAQLYLQEEGSVDSTFFAGEAIFFNKETEFADGHAFIPLKFNGHEYIFDPVNPHRALSNSDGAEFLLPRIQEVENFREKMGQGKRAYVETSSVLDQSRVWYGTGDGSSVLERHFV